MSPIKKVGPKSIPEQKSNIPQTTLPFAAITDDDTYVSSRGGGVWVYRVLPGYDQGDITHTSLLSGATAALYNPIVRAGQDSKIITMAGRQLPMGMTVRNFHIVAIGVDRLARDMLRPGPAELIDYQRRCLRDSVARTWFTVLGFRLLPSLKNDEFTTAETLNALRKRLLTLSKRFDLSEYEQDKRKIVSILEDTCGGRRLTDEERAAWMYYPFGGAEVVYGKGVPAGSNVDYSISRRIDDPKHGEMLLPPWADVDTFYSGIQVNHLVSEIQGATRDDAPRTQALERPASDRFFAKAMTDPVVSSDIMAISVSGEIWPSKTVAEQARYAAGTATQQHERSNRSEKYVDSGKHSRQAERAHGVVAYYSSTNEGALANVSVVVTSRLRQANAPFGRKPNATQPVNEFFASNGFLLVPATNNQFHTLMDTLPCTTNALGSVEKDTASIKWTVSMLSNSGINHGDSVSDPEHPNDTFSIMPGIAVTTGAPVLWSPRRTDAAGASSIVASGNLGSGKSVGGAIHLAIQFALAGQMSIIDARKPDADYKLVSEILGGEYVLLDDRSIRENPGAFDPFYTAASTDEALSILTKLTTNIIIGTDDDQEASRTAGLITRAFQEAVNLEGARSGMEILNSTAAKQMGEYLDVIRNQLSDPNFALVFGETRGKAPGEGITNRFAPREGKLGFTVLDYNESFGMPPTDSTSSSRSERIRIQTHLAIISAEISSIRRHGRSFLAMDEMADWFQVQAIRSLIETNIRQIRNSGSMISFLFQKPSDIERVMDRGAATMFGRSWAFQSVEPDDIEFASQVLMGRSKHHTVLAEHLADARELSARYGRPGRTGIYTYRADGANPTTPGTVPTPVSCAMPPYELIAARSDIKRPEAMRLIEELISRDPESEPIYAKIKRDYEAAVRRAR